MSSDKPQNPNPYGPGPENTGSNSPNPYGQQPEQPSTSSSNPYGQPPQGPPQPPAPNPYGDSKPAQPNQPSQPQQTSQSGQQPAHPYGQPDSAHETRQFPGAQQSGAGQGPAQGPGHSPYGQQQVPPTQQFSGNQQPGYGQGPGHSPYGQQHFGGGQQAGYSQAQQPFSQHGSSSPYGFAGAAGSTSTSAGTTTTGSNKTIFIVIGVLVAVIIAAVIASFALLGGGNGNGQAASTSSSSSAGLVDPAATDISATDNAEPSETTTEPSTSSAPIEREEINVDESTGDESDLMIRNISLSDEMMQHVDTDVFVDVTLEKFKDGLFPEMEYGASAVLTTSALDDPKKLVEAINELTERYCFFGFNAEGVRHNDTRISVHEACHQGTDVEEFSGVINAVKDYEPYDIEANDLFSEDYSVSFFNVDPDTIEEEYGDMRGVEGTDISVRFFPEDYSETLKYTLTADGLEEE